MASSKFDNLWNTLSSYNFPIDSDFSLDIICQICSKIMIDPHISSCGCRFCFSCINQYIGGEQKYCPGQKTECSEDYLIFENNLLRDVVTRRKIAYTNVKCPNDLCFNKIEIDKVEEHLQTCLKKQKKCPYAIVGCINIGLREDSVKEHLVSDNLIHSTLLIKAFDIMRKDINLLKEIVEIKDKEINELKEKNELNKKEMDDHKQYIENNKFEMEIFREKSKFNEVFMKEIKKDIIEIKKESNRMNKEKDVLKKEIIVIKKEKEVEEIKKVVDAIKKRFDGFKQENDKINKEIDEIKNKFSINQKDIKDIKKELYEIKKTNITPKNKDVKEEKEDSSEIKTILNDTSFTEVFAKNFDKEICDMKNEMVLIKEEINRTGIITKEQIINSREDFAWTIMDFTKKTKKNGIYDSISFKKDNYTMCLRMKLEAAHLWFYLVIVKGDSDNKASWPMKLTVTFSIVHPKTMKNHESWRYLYGINIFEMENYKRPKLDKNGGTSCGVISVEDTLHCVSQNTLLVCCSLSPEITNQ